VAVERAQAAFPGSERLVAVAVYPRETGLSGADRAKAEADRAAFASHAQGGQVPSAVPSADGKALLVSFPLAGDDHQQQAATDQIRQRLADGAPAGLQTALTGSAGAVDDVFDAFSGMDGMLPTPMRPWSLEAVIQSGAGAGPTGSGDGGTTGASANQQPAQSPLGALDRLDEVPGIGVKAAQVIIAELGLDMGQFPTPAHLVSWARLSPRTIQSGAKRRVGATGKGNPSLKGVLGEVAAPAA
jgi:Transposase IS116/IS110/IS902 family/MMPL family